MLQSENVAIILCIYCMHYPQEFQHHYFLQWNNSTKYFPLLLSKCLVFFKPEQKGLLKTQL